MSPFQRKLSVLSRDRNYLIRAVMVTIGVCVAIGFFVGKFAKHEYGVEEMWDMGVEHIISYESERDRKELDDLLLGRGEPTPEAIAQYITFFGAFVDWNLAPRANRAKQDIREQVPPLHGTTLAIETHTKSLDAEQKKLFLNYSNALYEQGAAKKKAIAALREKADDPVPPRFANEFLGQVLAGDYDTRAEALPHFRAEVESYPRSDFSRFRLLSLSLELKKNDEARELLKDPGYSQLVSPQYAMQIGTRLRDIAWLANGVVRTDLQQLLTRTLPLSLFAGFIWFVLLVKHGGVDRLRSPKLLLFGLALLAGFLSVTLTRIFIVWQEDVFGFQQSGELVNDLLYCVSGIGLREEVAKILLFLPFVPFIAKTRTTLEILIAAGCVGLGFAVMENVSYFQNPGSAFPRMVSAAFIHISLTGILGLAVCRFWHFPKQCWEELVGTFVAVVMIHGAYDAFIIIPQLQEELGFIAFVIFVLTVRHYFRKVSAATAPVRHKISPLGIFVVGSGLVVGAAWIFSMRYFSLELTMEGVGKGAFLSAILAFVYINEFRNE